MGLKNKNSIFDLVAGNNPVESMDSQQGPTSQLPTDLASQVHVNSLQVVPGGVQNSPYQDLDGVPDPNFNTLSGVSDSPFQGQTGDHMVDLLTQTVTSTNSNQIYNPAPNTSQYQDLNGTAGPDFDNGPSSTLQQDSLLNTYNYQYGNSPEIAGPVPGGDSNSPYQDLNGLPGPNFNNGPDSTLQQDSLLNAYNYQYGNSPEIAGPVPGGDSNSTYQDLDGNPGPDFHGIVPTLHEDSLTQQYSYQHGDSAEIAGPANLDLDGNQGPNFTNGTDSTLHVDSLLNIYNYQHGNGSIGVVSNASAGPSTLDLNGNPGQLFDSGISSTLKQDLLASVYQSGINPGASYGAGQPGGIWPSVNPSPLASTPFADLNGIMPSQYLNNFPD